MSKDFRDEDLAGYCYVCGKPVLWHPTPNHAGYAPVRILAGVLVGMDIDATGEVTTAGSYRHRECADKSATEHSMTRLDITKPNRLLECAVRVISVEEAHLGVLEMETDQGFVPITVNRNVAAMLIAELAAFMAADEVTDEQPPANDG